MKVSKEKLINYIIWQGLAMLVFVVVYGSCNHYASLQENHYHLYLNWELDIPHIPLMMIFYRTLDIILIIVLWLLSPENMKRYAKSMIFSIFVAAPIFIFFPSKLGYPRLESFEQFETLYKILYTLDHPYNLFPSMHVTYASLGIWAIIRQYPQAKKWHMALWLWLGLICASIILVHQHHLADIPSGLLLAFLSFKIFFKTSEHPETQHPVQAP